MKRGVWNSEVKTCERHTPCGTFLQFRKKQKNKNRLQARFLCEPLSATKPDWPKTVFPSCAQARFKSREQLRQRGVAEAWRPAQKTMMGWEGKIKKEALPTAYNFGKLEARRASARVQPPWTSRKWRFGSTDSMICVRPLVSSQLLNTSFGTKYSRVKIYVVQYQ